MRGDEAGGGSGTYLVVADSLVRAARDIRVTADVVRDGLVAGLDDEAEIGHEELQEILAEFTSRWQSGADELIHRQHGIADRITDCARGYLDREADSTAVYLSLLAG